MPSTRRRNKCRPIFLLSWLLFLLRSSARLHPSAVRATCIYFAEERPCPCRQEKLQRRACTHACAQPHTGTRRDRDTRVAEPAPGLLLGACGRGAWLPAAGDGVGGVGRGPAVPPHRQHKPPDPIRSWPSHREPGREGWRQSRSNGFERKCWCWVIPAAFGLNQLLSSVL